MRTRHRLELPDGRILELGVRTSIVGVLNVTPDSFSDGGRHFQPDAAVARAFELESEGADVVEIGGESTRPGARPLSADEELSRIMPVLKRLVGMLQVPISIDTYKSKVARQALECGASIVNDVSALRFDPQLADVAAELQAPLVLMHMRGEPASMQKGAFSDNALFEIERDLRLAIEEAENRGVHRDKLIVDPGIGFGKSLEQNLEIIRHLDRFDALRLPIMVGTSRKSFIGKLTGKPEGERIVGTIASAVASIMNGAHFVRVHDVKEMVEAARVVDAVLGA